MAKIYEQMRENGTLDSYSADEAVGIVVNQLMFRKGVTRRKLGEVLGVSGANAGMKLRGETKWQLWELYAIAEFFNVDVTDLLPRKKETPAQPMLDGSPDFVAGTGFEPVTSGL